MLLGRIDEIVDVVPARNLADTPNRFLVDPGDHIKARRGGRQRGLEVIGFYHSHPDSPAVPSKTDLAEATYPDHWYLIVSLMAAPADIRAYRLQDGVFRSADLVPYSRSRRPA